MHYRGLVLADRGEVTQAERIYFRAYEIYQELHFEPGIMEVCDSLANLLLRRGKSRPALRFAQISLELKRKLGDRYGEAITLGTLGRIYLQQARYDEAEKAFREDLALAREIDDQSGIGIALNTLGEIAVLKKDYAGALAAYQENLSGDRGIINLIHAQIGLVRRHLAAGELPEAESSGARLAELFEKHPEAQGLADLLTGLQGALAWRRGTHEEGERLLRQAIASLRQKQYAADTIPFLYELRDLYLRQGETARAVAIMGEALDVWSTCGAERGVQEVEDWLREVDSPGLVRLALERHFPQHLVEDIISGKLHTAEPRVQPITVLFSDLRDYTTLSESLADRPRELLELLNEWFSEATLAIQRHGGSVDKFMGDAVMALFGVPEAGDDAPANAVRAALEMRDALSALNLRQKALGGPTLRIGIGIDTGEAVVGFIGSHLRQSFTAIGDVVNSASRLEGITKDYPGCDILISQRTAEAQSIAETRFLGQAQVKGRKQEIPIYQVLGLRQKCKLE